MLRKIASISFLLLFAAAAWAAQTRHFVFHYTFTVRNVEPGKPLRVWIPLAHSGQYQQVRVLSAKADLPVRKMRAKEYGNWMLYAATEHAGKAEYKFAVDYDVVRREHIANLTAPQDLKIPAREQARLLAPDRLVPITGVPAELAAKAVIGKRTVMEKAYALYDYVYNNMRYEKTGVGWGRGDTLYACTAKKGNCTDFHSLFISMARSQRIPALFEIGFSIPENTHSAEIPGYHCWSEFYSKKLGWVPVDISEAWRHPEKRAYFFGAHDDNRVQFTAGRDLTLNPPQSGAPLNYFVYPYVEIGGKEYANVSTLFSFQDVNHEVETQLGSSGSGWLQPSEQIKIQFGLSVPE